MQVDTVELLVVVLASQMCNQLIGRSIKVSIHHSQDTTQYMLIAVRVHWRAQKPKCIIIKLRHN